MIKSKKRKIYFGLFWVCLIISFVCFAIFLIFTANGYHLNTETLQLAKTGMVVINGKVTDVEVVLNGQKKKVDLPDRTSRLFPGPYNLTVQKEGFHNYQKSFQLSGGQAVVVDELTLILLQPKITTPDKTERLMTSIQKTNLSQKNQFNILGNEIWRDGNLVTRFSQPIVSAIYDEKSNHYFVQLGQSIHALLSDGSNDKIILQLGSKSPVVMAMNDNNLSYILEDTIYQAQLW